jgi:mono/diheme cytochrome c family protein
MIRPTLLTALLSASALLLTGCAGLASKSTPIEVWPDMDRQHKFTAQSENPLFSDKRTQRRPPEGTVAVGFLKEDDTFHSGRVGGNMYVGLNPLFPYDKATLEHGQRKFNTYCAPCHGQTGNGGGIVGKRAGAVLVPSNLINQDPKVGVVVRGYTDGEIYEVVSNGRRTMKGYKYQISARDRWAIVAYVRVLQRQSGSLEDVPENLRSSLR